MASAIGQAGFQPYQNYNNFVNVGGNFGSGCGCGCGMPGCNGSCGY